MKKLILILFSALSLTGCATGGGSADPALLRALSEGFRPQPVQYQTIQPYQAPQQCYVQSLGGGYSNVSCH